VARLAASEAPDSASIDAKSSAPPEITTPTRDEFPHRLPRSHWPMDFRPSSAVVDERVNQLAGKVTERREQLIGPNFMRDRFGGHSD
jgi:hypothetical protein